MGNASISISIVIPAYNEEKNIQEVLSHTLNSLPNYFKDWEIIVVNDGSTDKTGTLVNKLAKNNPHLKVIHRDNGGFSRAMHTGIMAATKEFVAYMPADGQFLIDDMRHCFEKLDSNDLILGYRGSRPDYTLYRMILSYGYLLLLLLLFRIKWIDIGWVFIWRTKKVQALKLHSLGGIFLLTESVVKFQKKGYKIDEAPSYYRPRRAGEAKNAKFKVVRDTFLNAVKLWFEMKLAK